LKDILTPAKGELVLMNNSLVYQTIREKLDYNAFLLFFCGLSALYWELLLIRWLNTCVRAIA
jgi:hypothetical protein